MINQTTLKSMVTVAALTFAAVTPSFARSMEAVAVATWVAYDIKCEPLPKNIKYKAGTILSDMTEEQRLDTALYSTSIQIKWEATSPENRQAFCVLVKSKMEKE